MITHDPMATYVVGRTMTLDVVLDEGQTAEQAAAWLADVPAARGKVRWTVVHEHGPGGGHPVIRFDADEALENAHAQRALFGIYQRYSGVNVGRNAGKPPAKRGQKR